jgi:hypothetical protein
VSEFKAANYRLILPLEAISACDPKLKPTIFYGADDPRLLKEVVKRTLPVI